MPLDTFIPPEAAKAEGLLKGVLVKSTSKEIRKSKSMADAK
jgi:hypothetical protein